MAVDHVHTALGVSERRACKTLDQHRSTQRKPKVIRDDEAALTADIIRLASKYGRYGYPLAGRRMRSNRLPATDYSLAAERGLDRQLQKS